VPDTDKTFRLRGPRDLLEKLDYDITRLARLHTTNERLLAFAAFDCAVDAWSLVDWVWEWLVENGRETSPLDPTKGAPEKFIRAVQSVIPGLSTCRQLATGAKHFRVRRGNREDIVGYVEDADPNAPDNLFFGHMRVARAKILEGSYATEAYSVFERARLGWIHYLDSNQIDVRSNDDSDQ
jgi:hypothetical protein